MADTGAVSIKAGSERKFQVAGVNAQGNPAPLDPGVALVLAPLDGDSAIRQSADGHDIVIIGAPTEAVGHVSIKADSMDPDQDPELELAVEVTGTHDSANDAVHIGLTAVGDEAPLGSLS